MDPKLQRRVQRYGWDLAAQDYEMLWAKQLAEMQARLVMQAALKHGERVLDLACGTGLVSLAAAQALGAKGSLLGVDISDRMVKHAETHAQARKLKNVRFARMDVEALDLPDAGFDAALCSLGLMYMPEPERALGEIRRVLRPGGRVALAVWGERAHCAWSALFPIVDAEVTSEVCPLFFQLGQPEMLARYCTGAGFESIQEERISAVLHYPDAEAACDAAFVGGPVALAWSRFDPETRARVRRTYIAAIAPWRHGDGYRLPSEFILVTATAPANVASAKRSKAD